jgi:membrane protein implicated in regulation of membrane protease activity
MFNSDRPRTVTRWLIKVAAGVLLGLLAGVLINWQFALGMVLIYFVVAWAAERGQKQKRETDAYREQWLGKRKSNGAE